MGQAESSVFNNLEKNSNCRSLGVLHLLRNPPVLTLSVSGQANGYNAAQASPLPLFNRCLLSLTWVLSATLIIDTIPPCTTGSTWSRDQFASILPFRR
jgi:hypothetical protein